MTQKNLSPFGEAAVALDHGFSELQELGGQLERLTLDDAGLERARIILTKFSKCGQQVGEGLQTMANTLNEARSRAEKTAEMVSKRAAEIQERQKETDRLASRFGALGESFKKITTAIAAFQKPAGSALTEEEKQKILANLPEIDAQLATLSADATQLKTEAQSAKLKVLEKNADSLAQSLTSMRGRLSSFIEKPATLH